MDDTAEIWRETKQDKVWRSSNVSALERWWDSRPEHDICMKTVAEHIIGKSVLDVGCGIGDLCRYIDSDVKYLGVDQSNDMLMKAQERTPGTTFIQGNLYNLKLPETKFDTVVCLDVLHHQPALEPGFSNLMKLTKKCLIVTIWINGRDGVHQRQYIGGMGEIITWHTEEELEKKFMGLGLNYEVYQGVGFKWKDIYCFLL